MAHGQRLGLVRPVLPPIQNNSKFTQTHAGRRRKTTFSKSSISV